MPQNLIKEKLTELIEQTFNREGSLYFACNDKNAFFTSEQTCSTTGSGTRRCAFQGYRSHIRSATRNSPRTLAVPCPLFLVYINDMPETISSTARLFADVSLVYRIIHTKEDLLQKDLDKIQKWERDWLMQFNPDKCEVIRITNKRNPLTNKYYIHDTELLSKMPSTSELQSVQTYHGTSMWITVKKATKSLNFLKRNLHGCPSGVKDQCYKSLVRPILEYSSCVWDLHTQRNVNKLEMVQRRAARFVKGDYERTSSVTSMLTDLHWNILQERRMQVKSAMLYRIVHTLVAIPVTPFLIPVRTSRGHSMKFFIPQSTVNSHLYSFFPSTIRIWNQLPECAVSASSLETFKQRQPFFTF